MPFDDLPNNSNIILRIKDMFISTSTIERCNLDMAADVKEQQTGAN